MVGIGLYIRLGILETPVFARILEERRVERTPVIEVHQTAAEADHPDCARANG